LEQEERKKKCNMVSEGAKDTPCGARGQLVIATPFMHVTLSTADLNYSILKLYCDIQVCVIIWCHKPEGHN
jgi:hypothetical protein